jgi:hypothetical protein
MKFKNAVLRTIGPAKGGTKSDQIVLRPAAHWFHGVAPVTMLMHAWFRPGGTNDNSPTLQRWVADPRVVKSRRDG